MTTKHEVLNATPVGKFAYFGEYMQKDNRFDMETFSVGIFMVMPKKYDREEKKAGIVVFRLKGVKGHEEWVASCAQFICDSLNGFQDPVKFFGVHLRSYCRQYRDEYIKEHKPTWI